MSTGIIHLKLVSTRNDSELEKPVVASSQLKQTNEEWQQLGFNFEDKLQRERVIVLVAMDSIHGRNFLELIETFKPKTVLDMRYAVRFDLPGTNRNRIFQHFRTANILYSMSPIAWHQLTAGDFMLNKESLSQRLDHEAIERKGEGLMVLLPKAEHERLLGAYLNSRLSRKADFPWRIEYGF